MSQTKSVYSPVLDMTIPVMTAPMVVYGAQSDGSGGPFDPLFNLIGKGIGQTMDDPAIQAALQLAGKECQSQAEKGIGKFFQKNWPWFVVGGMGFISLNAVTLGVVLAAQRGNR